MGGRAAYRDLRSRILKHEGRIRGLEDGLDGMGGMEVCRNLEG